MNEEDPEASAAQELHRIHREFAIRRRGRGLSVIANPFVKHSLISSLVNPTSRVEINSRVDHASSRSLWT